MTYTFFLKKRNYEHQAERIILAVNPIKVPDPFARLINNASVQIITSIPPIMVYTKLYTPINAIHR